MAAAFGCAMAFNRRSRRSRLSCREVDWSSFVDAKAWSLWRSVQCTGGLGGERSDPARWGGASAGRNGDRCGVPCPERGGVRMSRSRNRRTDYGTIVLHWALVAWLLVAFLSGLRIASETPDRTWINLLDIVLPRATVWTAHMPAGLALVAVALAYPVYMSLSGLARRVRLDRVRMVGRFARAPG